MVGRKAQLEQINDLKTSKKSEFVAVMGRRRVGKTYLIDEAFKEEICFQLTGIQTDDTTAQLDNFNRKFFLHSKAQYQSPAPNDWGEAFFQLRAYLETLSKKQKQVIFLDELPWMHTAKSGFLQQLAHFWNDYLSKNNHYILIVCGSASSWIANNITNDKGGLHNRLTAQIHLKPFTLEETKEFLVEKNINITNQEIAKMYMAFGGIPYYLDDIKRGETATQAIERMCFLEDGRLKNEYDNLYKALFHNSLDHERIVEALAGSQKGMIRSQIIEKSKIRDGGPFTRAMYDLLTCGFVATINQFGQKKREEVYKLNDEYSSFYHRFIKSAKKYKMGAWAQQSTSQQYKIWLGYAFELLAFRHIDLIKNKLGISGIYSEISTLYYNIGKKEGLQIDILIDRKDNAINYCEIKHYDAQFKFDEKYYIETKAKIEAFKEICGPKKQVFFTMITNQPITENEYSLEIVDKRILLDNFFGKA
jgi:uncharacterized protein